MSRYVVSYMNFHYNNLQSRLVEADTWQSAVRAANYDLDYALEGTGDVEGPVTLEDAQFVAFNADEMFNVLLIE